MKIVALLIVVAAAWYGASRIKRLHDPNDYASYYVRHEPRISTAKFEGLHAVDPVSHAAGIAAIREFSRQYQQSFLAETDPERIVRDMSRSRMRMNREFHALRMWLPNDAVAERQLVSGIEETDAAMALAMADLAARFPSVKLAHGAGILASPVVRAAEDTWL
jgi:hypothetical protein